MKKSKIVFFIAIVISVLTLIGVYVKGRVMENRNKQGIALVQSLGLEGEEHLKKLISAIENGDYIKISSMLNGVPEQYKNYDRVKMKLVDKKLDYPITNSNTVAPVYILKFQACEPGVSIKNPDFYFLKGFYYTKVRLIKSQGKWYIPSIGSGKEYF